MRIQTLRSLAEDETTLDWLVEGLVIKGNWTYLIGLPGSGKSMLSLQMVKAIQNGEAFLGMKTKKSNCLYIQSDASEGEWQEQVRKIAPESIACTLYNVPKGWCEVPAIVSRIRRIIWGLDEQAASVTGKEPFDFIVFDALRSLMDGDPTPTTGFKALRTLTAMCSSTGDEAKLERSFLLIHHPSKMQARSVNAGSGWGGFASDCGIMLTLAGTLLNIEKGRTIKQRQIPMQRDEQGLWYVEEEKAKPAYQKKASEYLAMHPELNGI